MKESTLIYITGTPGSGKSAVCNKLKRRGYVAYDTDKDAIAFFYNNITGEALRGHIPSKDRTPQWRREYTWKAKRETVERLIADAKSDPVFLCGVTANDADELWDLFSKVFALVISDERVLKERVENSDEDGYGKNPHELAALLEWQKTAAAEYKTLGAILIDAPQPLAKVVDTVRAQV